MNQSEEQRSTEESNEVISTSAKMLRLICIKVIDPKNEGNMAEYTILRVPMYTIDGIKANYPGRVKFTTKGAYKHFVNDVRKQNHGGTATSIGASAKEIRYANIIKKETVIQTTTVRKGGLRKGGKAFTFPMYKEGNTQMMASDAKEADRNEKIAKGNHNTANCRKRTKSRIRTSKGVYTPTGLPVMHANGYDIIADTYRKAGKAMPMDHQRDRERTDARKAKIN